MISIILIDMLSRSVRHVSPLFRISQNGKLLLPLSSFRLRKEDFSASSPSPSSFQTGFSLSKGPNAVRSQWLAEPNFDINELKKLMDHDNHQMRDDFRDFLKKDLFKPRYNLSLVEERELALKRLKAICDVSFV